MLLEDERSRLELMLRPDGTLLGFPVVLHDNAPDLLAWLQQHLNDAVLIALDHDLGPSRLRDGIRFEPGIGRDVVEFLAERGPVCPVVIHSSNSPAALGMQFRLEAAGWSVTRVIPFDGMQWIERDWLPEVERALNGGAQPVRGAAQMAESFNLDELLARRPAGTAPWLPFLDLPSMLVGVYVVAADDRMTHQPHALDEVYYAVRGVGKLSVEGEDRPVQPGTVLYVPAGGAHYFHSIEEELTLLVFFPRT
ncbi:MAG: hypothetical protein K0Q72_1376 [Armatimonadetes bacterium]|nr:hypothetical protein [Armatimonadota bacterium]